MLAAGASTGASAPPVAAPWRIGLTGGWEAQVDPLVAAASGRVEIDVAYQDAHNAYGMEQSLIEAVATGELDLAYVGTRAFAALGVHSFEALTAPFLIDSYAMEEAVLESELPSLMLAGIESLGVTGVAVAAGHLRRPLAVDAPLLGLDDFAGVTFHSYPRAGHATTIEALGATHTDVYGPERDAGLEDGSIDATENALSWAQVNGRTNYVTSNVVFWPSTAALIANPDSLSAADLEWLRGVAENALATSEWFAADDQAMVALLCSAGDRFATASDDDVAALRAAVTPVYDELSADPETAEYIEAIEALRASIIPAELTIPAGCIADAPEST